MVTALSILLLRIYRYPGQSSISKSIECGYRLERTRPSAFGAFFRVFRYFVMSLLQIHDPDFNCHCYLSRPSRVPR